MGKKNRKHKSKTEPVDIPNHTNNKPQKISHFRTEQERRFESLNIIYQLKQNNLTSEYPAIKELLEKLNIYVLMGQRMEINIPFPEKQKRIKGVLAIHKGEEVVVVLTSM
tara:strand:+ start:84 stop:413 length:330 start_codon:yes stop_codon:yes gene_type:complete